MTRPIIRRTCRAALAALAAGALCTATHATTVRPTSVVDLIDRAETIVAGEVQNVTDGFDAKGVPYTEVTLKVRDTIRGNKGDTYTFRQFGFEQSRTMKDGRVYLGSRPTGWPAWHKGENAIVFLYPRAKYTGLQTTVGLGYGKVSVANGVAMNAYDNAGLFAGVNVDRTLLDNAERSMFDTRKGAVDETTFRKFLHRAVEGDWTKKGSISNGKR